jgi:hypothetical protein
LIPGSRACLQERASWRPGSPLRALLTAAQLPHHLGALGYRRLIYTNTASVIETVAAELTAAMGDNPQVTAVLLTCTDATARRRLAQREIGTALDWHLERSAQMARRLDKRAPGWVHPGGHRRTEGRRHRGRGHLADRLDHHLTL